MDVEAVDSSKGLNEGRVVSSEILDEEVIASEVQSVISSVLPEGPRTYQIRPEHDEKFKALTVKEIIHGVLSEELEGKEYSTEEAEKWVNTIADSVRSKVRELAANKYKYVVQVVICEQHGAGVRIGARCLWDAESDNYASDVFVNDSIVCMVAVFAIYFY